MTATPYKPVSWNDRSLSTERLQQMANNDQWLFENSPRIRYSANNITRDSGLKVIAGKTAYAAQPTLDYTNVEVYFGSFFTVGCRPSVSTTVETSLSGNRKFASIRGFGGQEVDYRGFIAHVTAHETVNHPWGISGGWVHWIAIGY